MISVEQALAQALDLVSSVSLETVRLQDAAGRVLAKPLHAVRPQPPFASSAMDGYAMRAADVRPGATATVIGESAAGKRFQQSVGPVQAVRIFTGAPVPQGADRIVIQEDVLRQGDVITLKSNMDTADYIRPIGSDFGVDTIFSAPKRLTANDVALLASMNYGQVEVFRKPIVALIATGNELVMPGEIPGADQIIASNNFGLAALATSHGAEARLLPIARDTIGSLKTVFALAHDADLIVTIGGASVGDHDLVGQVALDLGMAQSFYKVAMRPGKPLMAGKMGTATLLGLPGNPVSSMVCGHIFMVPMLRALQGLGKHPAPRSLATLGTALAPNGPREHYMRATIAGGIITAADRQDSSLLTVLTEANALIVSAPGDPARGVGEKVEYLAL